MPMNFLPRQRLPICLPVLLLLWLSGCASTAPVDEPAPEPTAERVQTLEVAILDLSADIDRDEARRAAVIAIEYPLQLAQEYEIENSPLMHNFLVNVGAKPRGLCTHWTWDLYARLQQERFKTIDLHWGIANYQSAFRLEHSTVIISAEGEDLQQGLVLDPWRLGGPLFFARTTEDPDYQWYPHAEIHALKRERKALALNRPPGR